MSDAIRPLQERLREHADADVKAWWENYVKESAPFLGVKMPVIRKIVHAWHSDFVAEFDALARLDLALALIREDHTEEKLAGVLLFQEILLPANAVDWRRDLPRFGELFRDGHLADWNVVDWFCVKVLGPLIEREGPLCGAEIGAWRDAPVLWHARASAVPFVKVIARPEMHPLALRSCEALIGRPERFAKTAVGWVLRDLSKYDEGLVVEFVDRHLTSFSLESLRNALKAVDKKTRDRHVARFRRDSGGDRRRPRSR